MPKLANDSTTPTPKVKAPKPKPPVSKASGPRPIIYPTRQQKLCHGADALGEEMAKKALGWETEAEYCKRRMEGTDLTEEACQKLFREPDEWGAPAFLFKDFNGEWVRCWNNWGNRPFDETHMMGLSQTMLTRRWADSRNGPDMTDNGEAIIISRTGRIDSGQHRLIAVPIACQQRRKSPKKWPLWTEDPSIETVLSVGVSDNPQVTMTLDNVKPRSVADNLMTSEHFKDLNQPQRKECTRMLEKAIEFVWRRVEAGGYRTNQASLDFLDKHKTLEKLVKHIFDENKNRAISLLRLSAGQMAGVCYLMAASPTDGDVYRNGDPPSEKLVDLSRLDLAQDFFVLLSSKHKQLIAVHHAIGALVGDDAEGLGGRSSEKLAILAQAWAVLAKNPKATVSEHDVALTYWEDAEGVKYLLPGDDGFLNCFGGIDTGEKARKTSSQDGIEAEDGPEAPPPSSEGVRPKMAKDYVPSELDKAKESAKAASKQALIDAHKKRQEAKKDKAPIPAKPPVPKMLPAPTNKKPGATSSKKA